MTADVRIEIRAGFNLTEAQTREIVALCTRAYEEPFAEILASFGDATHVLASVGTELVSHALWVPRTLTADGTALRTAYVEAVATEPRHQHRGYASGVLRALAAAIATFELGALSPSDAAFYARLGWEPWYGPLAVVADEGIIPTPGNEVMILRLPRTPPLDPHRQLTASWRAGEIW